MLANDLINHQALLRGFIVNFLGLHLSPVRFFFFQHSNSLISVNKALRHVLLGETSNTVVAKPNPEFKDL